jgi:hypothetical protein
MSGVALLAGCAGGGANVLSSPPGSTSAKRAALASVQADPVLAMMTNLGIADMYDPNTLMSWSTDSKGIRKFESQTELFRLWL